MRLTITGIPIRKAVYMTVEQDHCESSSGHDSSVNCLVSRPLFAANLSANESAIEAADIGST